MIHALFVLFIANTILRLNDFVPGFQGFPLVLVVAPALVILWFLFEKKEFSAATDVYVPLFFGVCVLGYGLMVWPAGMVAVFKEMAVWTAVYFLAANLCNTRARMATMFAALYVCALVLVSHSLQQWLTYDGVNDASGVGWSGTTVFQGRSRYVGIMYDPNDLGLFFVMMLPLVLQLSAAKRDPFIQVGGYLLCLPLLAGIFWTNSRGAMLATGAIAFLHSMRKWGWFKAGTLCACMAMAVLALGPSRIREKSDSDEMSSKGRIWAWYEGFQIFKQYPLTGCGYDEFTNHHYLTAHNSFVLCFAETGIVGYYAWVSTGVLCMYGLHHVLKRTRRAARSERQTSAVFDALVAFYVGGFFLSRTYYVMLALFLGLAVAAYRRARDDLEEGDPVYAGMPHPDYRDDAQPLPDLSTRTMGAWIPYLIAVMIGSLAMIYVIVRLQSRM